MKLGLWLTVWMVLLVIIVSTASANVNTLSHYRLGENDPGATPGGAATNIVNSAGPFSLTVSGPTTYSSAVVSNNFTATLLSLNLSGASLASNFVMSSAIDNFGLEVWVKPNVASGSRCLAYNGNSGANGWGLFQSGNNFRALFGGVTFFGSYPVVTNTWTHLALVRALGLATFYVNGVPVASTTSAPKTPDGRFALGGTPLPAPAEFYNGLLDEVRVFNFHPKGFSRNDLLFPPLDDRQLMITRETDFVRLTWPASDPETFLRSTTNLDPIAWAEVPRFYSNGLYHAIGPVDGPARFYQVAECNFLVTTPVMTLQQNSGSAFPLSMSSANSNERFFRYNNVQLRNNRTLTLDFSPSITATLCDTNELIYEWQIIYTNPNFPAPYRVAGITGYNTPTLHILTHSLLPTSGGQAIFSLRITRPGYPGFDVNCEIPATITDTTLTLEQLNTCWTNPTNCTNPNALPVP